MLEYPWIQEMVDRNQYDVAVIRNPTMFNSYSLKDTVSALRTYRGIANIYCHFCRVKEEDIDNPAKDYNINQNVPPPSTPPP